jgi:N-glycosylase/DNA lyase
MAKSAFGGAESWGSIEAPGFDLEVSMTCGQIFGWEKRGAAYWGLISSSAVGIRQEADRVIFTAPPGVSPADIARYLGLDEDLDAILRAITVDDFMEQVVSSVKGLRLFKQDPWP